MTEKSQVVKHGNRTKLGLAAAISLVLVLGCQQPARKNRTMDNRPNIILILADDMGFSDIGCYGGEIHTPNIDYLAKNGLRFTDFYNTSRCCPSRASLLTGLYNQQAGIGQMTVDRHLPGYRGHLTPNAVTLADVLRSAGYHTAMSGKWHVSNTLVQPTDSQQLAWLDHKAFHPFFSPVDQYPVYHGFEKFFGTLWGVVDYFDPFSLVYDTTPVRQVPLHYYQTDAINDSAASFIHAFSRDDKPFFLYVAENAPHWPLMARAEDIAKYRDTYKVGWQSIRVARYRKMARLGIIDTTVVKLSPRWEPGLTWNDNPDTVWDARAMAVHAAMIDCMDQGIGRIIDALKQAGRLNNTLIFFLSDNGASPEICASFGPGFDRPGKTRRGETILYPKNKEVFPGPETTYASIGPRWANVANTPYRYWKAESFEGGIHTPLIAFWPNGIAVPRGSITTQTGHVMDFMATVVEVAHATYPTRFKGHDITPMEGISLLPILKGKQREGHRELFNDHHGGRYARVDGWKIVSPDNDTTWQLYNLNEDAAETRNLARQYPGKVHFLDSLWHQWAWSDHVLPRPPGK